MQHNRKIFRVTIATTEVASFLEQCEASEWYAFDTGERVMTEEGPDAEAVLLVEPFLHTQPRTAAAMMH